MSYNITEIKLSDIVVGNRARKEFQDVDKLAQSIESQGLLYPILISPDYKLLGGERRMRAFELLQRDSIPCRVLSDIDPADHELIEYIENKERSNFKWHEEVMLKHQMHTTWVEADPSWTYRKSAAKLHCALGGLSSDLELAKTLLTFPQLAECETKGKAQESFKKMVSQASAMKAMKELPQEDMDQLSALLTNGAGSEPAGEIAGTGGKPVADRGSEGEISTIADPTCNPTNPGNGPQKQAPKYSYQTCTWRELLPKVSDNTVGMCELDPPYAIDYEKNAIYTNEAIAETDWEPEHYYAEIKDLLTQLLPKLLDDSWILFWCGYEHALRTNEIASNLGYKTQKPGIWEKPGGASNRPKQLMISNYETFLLLGKGSPQFNTKSFKGVQAHANSSFADKQHQWEKPTEMYDAFIKALGRPKTLFLSLFAGSGNAMLSAAKVGMTPMGCDIKKIYAAQFHQKFNNHFPG